MEVLPKNEQQVHRIPSVTYPRQGIACLMCTMRQIGAMANTTQVLAICRDALLQRREPAQ